MIIRELNPKLESKLKNDLGFQFEAIEEICYQWGIIELALFGSVLRDDFKSNSDLDILVTFEPNNKISLFDLETLEQQLETLFNRSVDLVTKKSIENSHNWIRRQNILDNSEVIYVKRS
jgi:hypothetical protein